MADSEEDYEQDFVEEEVIPSHSSYIKDSEE